ncbi:hypothetical protein B0T25DRAFT_542207 [Lasiosphaeria hispida]|uniref:Infection structure specific protein n=1 Tax=Lasiosphaeria hispida TaxID=260671 RepID=A0AAJ0MDW8_9PEZI|nr:hypothetical protein B0T25DRAFT_542207 [Lasiosphaeria hispida]
MLSKALLTTALAATALAATPAFPGHLADRAALQARQTDAGGATACLGALLSVYSTIPTPPPSLIDFGESASLVNPCSFTVPASLSSDFEKYESEMSSWASVNGPQISSALGECPEYSSLIDQVPEVCTTRDADDDTSVNEGATSTSGESSSETPTGGAAGTGLTTTARTTTATGGVAGASLTQTGAGPRETGFVGAVVAAAGFLGVVAAL